MAERIVWLNGPDGEEAGRWECEGAQADACASWVDDAIGRIFKLVCQGTSLLTLKQAHKTCARLTVDDAIRKNPAALAKTNRYLDNGLTIESGGVVKQSDGTVLGKLDNKDVYNPGELKVKGEHSGRHFDPDDAGGPIIKKSWTNPTINQSGIDDITIHLSRFEDLDGDNAFMIDRLKKIKNGEIPATTMIRDFILTN